MRPAEDVIRKCGGGNFAKGVNLISAWTGIHKTQVFRWSRPASGGGTGGMIPAQHQQKILDAARRESIALGPEDFFAQGAEAPAPVNKPRDGTIRSKTDVIVVGAGRDGPIAYLNGMLVDLAVVKRRIRDLEGYRMSRLRCPAASPRAGARAS